MRRFSRCEPIVPSLCRRDAIKYKTFVGKGTAELINLLTKLRIRCFREYPHLYDGSHDNEYEKEVAEELSRNKHTTIVTAHHDNLLIGFGTAFPLVSATQILDGVDPMFLRSGYRPSDFYYFSEGAVAPEFRSYAIAFNCYKRIESQAIRWGYAHACLATILRDDNDPRKPPDYRNPYCLWQRFGFIHTNIQFDYWWPTLMKDGSTCYLPNKHSIWLKCDIQKRRPG